MSDETLEELRTGVRQPIQKDRPIQAVAKEKLYTDVDDKTIGVPVEMLFASLREAGRGVKLEGMKKVSTAEGTVLPAFLTICDPFLPLTNQEWVVDKRRGNMQNGGKNTAVCVVRPKFIKWGFEVTIELDEKQFGADNCRKLFDLAGSRQGLGSFRPNKGGTFGRFRVVEWESKKIEDDVEEAA
ncbi:MAG: hypothetical protein AAB783_02025 [Patescibacteria group bacterium]